MSKPLFIVVSLPVVNIVYIQSERGYSVNLFFRAAVVSALSLPIRPQRHYLLGSALAESAIYSKRTKQPGCRDFRYAGQLSRFWISFTAIAPTS
ncbi:MAG TPA: hypothetical protein PKH19_04280 [Candidatus Syntrophosphaera sp.]|nr:hypothetical protein [Candidatus Syntrophosphaera sp.]